MDKSRTNLTTSLKGNEFSELEKENFDLKLKIYHLEDKNRKGQLDLERPVDVEEYKSEIANLKLLVEEKNIELDQRNALLIKARNAIESLKFEIERQKLDISKGNGNNSPINEESQRVSFFEQQNFSLKELIGKKDIEIENLQRSLDMEQAHSDSLKRDRDEMEVNRKELERRLIDTRDNLLQAQADIELYKIQIADHNQSADELKSILEEMRHQSKQRAADGADAVSSHQFECIMNQINLQNERTIASMQQEHAAGLAEAKQRLESEVRGVREREEAKWTDRIQREREETNALRVDFNQRFEEKKEEILSLQSLLEVSKGRQDALQSEIDNLQSRIKEFQSRCSNHEATSEALEATKNELKSSVEKIHELRNQLYKEQVDAARESAKGEQLQSLVLTLRETAKEKETSISAMENDWRKINEELSVLRVQYSNLKDSNGDLQRSKQQLLQSINEEKKHTSLLDEYVSRLEASESAVSSLRAELDKERRHSGRLSGAKEELHKTGVLCVTAMADWESQLGELLEGLDSSSGSSHNNNHGSASYSSSYLSRKKPLSDDEVTTTATATARGTEDFDKLFDLKQDSLANKAVVVIERLRGLVSRFRRVRSGFQSQTQRLESVWHTKFSVTSDRAEILSHKLREASSKLDRLRGVVEKDRSRREKEAQAMIAFREQMLGDHQHKVEELEQRLAKMTVSYEKEKAVNEELKGQLAELENDANTLLHFEKIISELSSRMSDLSVTHSQVVNKLDFSVKRIHCLEDEHRADAQEKASLLGSLESLSEQLQERDRTIRSLMTQVTWMNHSHSNPLRPTPVQQPLADPVQYPDGTRTSTAASHSGGGSASAAYEERISQSQSQRYQSPNRQSSSYYNNDSKRITNNNNNSSNQVFVDTRKSYENNNISSADSISNNSNGHTYQADSADTNIVDYHRNSVSYGNSNSSSNNNTSQQYVEASNRTRVLGGQPMPPFDAAALFFPTRSALQRFHSNPKTIYEDHDAAAAADRHRDDTGAYSRQLFTPSFASSSHLSNDAGNNPPTISFSPAAARRFVSPPPLVASRPSYGAGGGEANHNSRTIRTSDYIYRDRTSTLTPQDKMMSGGTPPSTIGNDNNSSIRSISKDISILSSPIMLATTGTSLQRGIKYESFGKIVGEDRKDEGKYNSFKSASRLNHSRLDQLGSDLKQLAMKLDVFEAK